MTSRQERAADLRKLIEKLPDSVYKERVEKEAAYLEAPEPEQRPDLKDGEWNEVGTIGVDAGMVWIGDPCYILHREKGLPSTLGKNWGEFCDSLGQDYPTTKSFNYEMGHEGLGICVSSGFGDGGYQVFVKTQTFPDWGKRITEMKVVFVKEEPEDGTKKDNPVE